ncbi:6501_t:CDS:1, partial [Dentiscutata heterogama]
WTISVERFGLVIGGATTEKRFKRRRDYIRGLIPDNTVAELLGLELPKRIVNRAL